MVDLWIPTRALTLKVIGIWWHFIGRGYPIFLYRTLKNDVDKCEKSQTLALLQIRRFSFAWDLLLSIVLAKMESNKYQAVESGNYSPVYGIKILVVDPHPMRLQIVSSILCSLGHEVLAATHTSDVLPILEGTRNTINLVLVEAHLPSMEIYELSQRIDRSYPICLFLTANDAQLLASHTRALRKEASVSQLIGDQVSDLRGLWRFSLCDGPCCGGDKVLKLNRYTWTDDIRNIFLEAIESSALSAPPNVPQLREDMASSYYQQAGDETLPNWNGCSCSSNSRSHQLCPLFLNEPGVPNKQKFLCNCLSQEQNQRRLLRNNLQGVAAHTTSDFGAFMNNGNGDASQDITGVGDNIDGKTLEEDSFLFLEDLFVTPEFPSSDENADVIFWPEAEMVSENPPTSEGNVEFNDEDLEKWIQELAEGI